MQEGAGEKSRLTRLLEDMARASQPKRATSLFYCDTDIHDNPVDNTCDRQLDIPFQNISDGIEYRAELHATPPVADRLHLSTVSLLRYAFANKPPSASTPSETADRSQNCDEGEGYEPFECPSRAAGRDHQFRQDQLPYKNRHAAPIAPAETRFCS